jgi:hypothetical protein
VQEKKKKWAKKSPKHDKESKQIPLVKKKFESWQSPSILNV